MKNNIFSANAYCVLGLDVSANGREITRRAKQIEKLLQIGETPSFDRDIFAPEENRNEESVAQAVQTLSNVNKRIRDYFFWFDLNDEADEKAYQLLQENEPDAAYAIWLDKWENNKEYSSLKNSTIARTIFISKGNEYMDDVESSIFGWRTMLGDEGFWEYFAGTYLLNDELGTDINKIKLFHEGVELILADYYSDLTKDSGDNRIYATFADAFRTRSVSFSESVLEPIFLSINDEIEKIQNYKIKNILNTNRAGFFQQLQKEIQEFKNNISKQTMELNQLGLWDDSDVIVLRDAIAMAFRGLSIQINNEGLEICHTEDVPEVINLATSLLKTAKQVAGTQTTENRLQKDIDEIIEIKAGIKHSEDVVKLISKLDGQMARKDYSAALLTVSDLTQSPLLSSVQKMELYELQIKLLDAINRRSTGACYIATAVYGSYDSKEVLVLRRFRDDVLKKTLFGRAFITVYYCLSPYMVKYFGQNELFIAFWRNILDKWTSKLM